MTRTSNSPLAGGIPFGGDSFTSALPPTPPPIGFRTDLLERPPSAVVVVEGPSRGEDGQPQHPPPLRPPQASAHNLAASSESLYQADAWARLWFPRVMILCLLRMLLFIRKVYEDFHATKVYNLTGQTGFLLVSALSLLLPTLVFTLYRVARYLQLVLPGIREAKAAAAAAAATETATRTHTHTHTQHQKSPTARASRKTDDDEAQLTRALMTGSPESAASAGQQRGATPTQSAAEPPDEGLVTARQSPTEQFHDSEEQPAVASAPQTATGAVSDQLRVARAPSQPRLESLDVDKLGNLPDRDHVRVVLGACEQFLHGVLFVFWQLKRQVDVMGYLVERACLWRKPAEREREELARLRTGSDGLEWFQDFYAAFLAILAQVFMLSAYWSGGSGSDNGAKPSNSPPISGTQLNAATSGLPLGDEPSSPVSESVRILSSLFGTQTLAGGANGHDMLLVSELVVSSAVILSLLICVRRRDDGPLTLGLSMLGWGSLFAARILAIGLAFVHIGWRIMTPLVILHVLAITAWLYHIALASHNDAPSERQDEAEWDEQASTSGGMATEEVELADKRPGMASEQEEGGGVAASREQAAADLGPPETSKWSLAEHLALLAQILTLFAIPSLFYWPIMFNLKLHLRVFKYLVLILIQNFLLIPAVWMAISTGHSQVAGGTMGVQPTIGQLYLLATVGVCSVLGFIFISLYVACKPSLTEYFARADELFNEAEQSGVYYEFCSRVFKMPDLSKTTFRRLMDQSEELVEERYELVSETTKTT